MKILSVLGIVAIVSCGEAAPPATENVAPPARTNDQNLDERTELVFAKFKKLYAELGVMKSQSTFHQFGFGAGGPHSQWLSDVRSFISTDDARLLARKGVFANELEALGMEYASSGGQETDQTQKWNALFVQAIEAKPIEEVKSTSGSASFNALQSEAELVGRWSVSNTFAKESYPFEIYKRKNGEFVGIYPARDFKSEELELKGSDYFVKASISGEFYRIDKNRKMSLFDKDGELASSGWQSKLVD